ncbi:MAG: LysR family transcriptional regulator [Cellvibrionaceae bacterium]
MLKLRHIEVFTYVMRTGSVSEAARELHVSQPAVSKTLQHAESRLGIELFKRVNGRLQPTPEAGLLFSAAQEIEDALYRFNKISRDVRNVKVGELRITAAPALAIEIIPTAVQHLKKKWPELRLHIDVQPNESIKEQINYCRADLGVVHFPSNENSLEAEIIKRGEIKCIVPNENPLSSQKKITAKELEKESLIYCSGGTWWSELLKKEVPWLNEQEPESEVNYFTVACQLANKGLGIVLVDEFSLFSQNLENVSVIPFAPQIPVTFGVLHNSHNSLSKPAEEFISVLKNLM